jgi:hypothetical protein
MNIPLLLFVYNRPRHTARTLRALAANVGASATRLIIFSDGSGGETDIEKVGQVREVCRQAAGFASVDLVEREGNLGVADSVVRGVSEALSGADAVVVMEDDLIASPHFLTFMIGALHAYQDDPRLLSVSAFVPPRFLMPRPRSFQEDVWLSRRNLSFGWGVWKDRWASVDWPPAGELELLRDEKLREAFARGGRDLPLMLEKQLRGETDSWAIHFSYAHFRQQKVSLLPRDTYIRPIGMDGSGVHCRISPMGLLSSLRHAKPHPGFPQQLEPHEGMQTAFQKAFDRQTAVARLLGRV